MRTSVPLPITNQWNPALVPFRLKGLYELFSVIKGVADFDLSALRLVKCHRFTCSG